MSDRPKAAEWEGGRRLLIALRCLTAAKNNSRGGGCGHSWGVTILHSSTGGVLNFFVAMKITWKLGVEGGTSPGRGGSHKYLRAWVPVPRGGASQTCCTEQNHLGGALNLKTSCGVSQQDIWDGPCVQFVTA